MYVIVKFGGKQYKLQEGEEVSFEKIRGNVGDKVEIAPVLFFSSDGKNIVAPEELAKVRVEGTILEHFREKKITVFKYKPKKGYQQKQGHRQILTKVRVDSIKVPRAKAKVKKKEDGR